MQTLFVCFTIVVPFLVLWAIKTHFNRIFKQQEELEQRDKEAAELEARVLAEIREAEKEKERETKYALERRIRHHHRSEQLFQKFLLMNHCHPSIIIESYYEESRFVVSTPYVEEHFFNVVLPQVEANYITYECKVLLRHYNEFLQATRNLDKIFVLEHFAKLVCRGNKYWPQIVGRFRFITGHTPDSLKATQITLCEGLFAAAESAPYTTKEFYELLELYRLIFGPDDQAAFCRFRNNVQPPSDWNGLVTKHLDIPLLSDFDNLRPYRDMPTGSVRRIASRALKDSSQVQLKIALAYCNASQAARLELGDVLLAECEHALVYSHSQVTNT